MRRAATFLAACIAVLVTACGQKGPLTLPDKSAVVTIPQAANAPAAAPTSTPAAAPEDKGKAKSANPQPPK